MGPDLTLFTCQIGYDEFSISATDEPAAWLVVMQRYNAESFDQLPRPRRMRPAPKVVSGEIEDGSGAVVAAVIDGPSTLRVDLAPMVAALRWDREP